MQHFDASAPGPGGVRPVDIEAGGDDAAPPLDECVDVRARMLDNDAKAWRRMTIDMVCLFARMLDTDAKAWRRITFIWLCLFVYL